ncbi:MAG: FixH family protein [Pyrinomonadaceae bacterium]
MKKFTIALSLIGLVMLAVACGSKEVGSEKIIKSGPAGNNLTVSLATSDGVLKHGNTEFTLSFTDSSGKPVDVGAVALTFHMPQMGTMQAMNDAATFTTTDTPGVYRGKANIEMAGEWQAQITYDGPAGRGQASFPVTAQ